MPLTASFIDAMRAEFGVEGVNDSIRRGMRGEAGMFWAREGGREIGTRDPRQGVPVTVAPVVVIGKARK